MQVHFVKTLYVTYHSLSPSHAVDITYFPKSIYMEIRIQWLRKWFPPFGVLATILLYSFFVHALYVAHIIFLIYSINGFFISRPPVILEAPVKNQFGCYLKIFKDSNF